MRTKVSENPITVEEMIRGLPTLVVALDQIHRHNILHRDISPGNIIMSENGAFYLLDFEAATSVRTERLKNFRVYAHKGFDAPEHLKYDLHGVPMDIYSLCATITYLLTGYGIPVPEDRRVSDPIPHILMSSYLSKKQQNAILKGLCIEIEARYQNITEFALDFLNTEISPVRMRGTQMMCYSAKTDRRKMQAIVRSNEIEEYKHVRNFFIGWMI